MFAPTDIRSPPDPCGANGIPGAPAGTKSRGVTAHDTNAKRLPSTRSLAETRRPVGVVIPEAAGRKQPIIGGQPRVCRRGCPVSSCGHGGFDQPRPTQAAHRIGASSKSSFGWCSVAVSPLPTKMKAPGRAVSMKEKSSPSPGPGGDLRVRIGEAVHDGGEGSFQEARRRMRPRMNSAPASSSAMVMYSSAWCAWAMEPGPQTTVERPASWNWPASVM